ncbi:coiled-coil domain-containing protein [Clostridium neonatale]|uniref:Membrane protein n=1 Tax=Clostridium neonatale TaxID=137838 RepID=A0AA86JHS1_9CLOT
MKKGNFFYLKNTSLSEYYTDIIKAQCASDKYPMITKILLRKIVEDIVRKVAKKYGIYSKENMRNLITSIKYNFNICFPEQICKCINTIRFNGINKENYDIENAKIFNSTDLLKMANRIFIWYIKDIEKVSDFNEDDAVIILPNNLDVSKEELEKTIDDIVSKENQINALRERVIDLANNSQNVSGLNRVVIAIKEEKALLEEKKEYLSEEIKIYEDSILDIESSYESEMKELNTLRSEWDKIQTLISEKEDKLVKVEINNQDFKMLASNFEGNKDEIIKYELLINESLDKLRKGYKNLSILCKEYKDILATITFSYKDEYKNDLIGKESRTRININKEDKLFEEEMIIYFNNIDEANKNVRVLKKILNDQITKQIKYYEFYKGFLNLRGNSLKRLYVLSNKFSVQSILMNTAKNIFGIPDKEGIDEYINKKIEEISDVSDAEIKLHIYYRLINIAKVEVKCVCNRKGFTENLDNIVQKAHEFLKSREWIKGDSDYLKAISIYYLQRITNNIKSNYYNNQIVMQSNLIDDIFNNIKKFNEEEKNIFIRD